MSWHDNTRACSLSVWKVQTGRAGIPGQSKQYEILPKKAFTTGDWRHDSGVISSCCSCGGPGFTSQQPSWVLTTATNASCRTSEAALVCFLSGDKTTRPKATGAGKVSFQLPSWKDVKATQKRQPGCRSEAETVG